MLKLLNKKEIITEESPIMLQRRHTIMEVDKDCNLAEPKLKSIARSNSTSSLNQTKNKLSEGKADTTLSPEVSISASNASTVVITESELSSSWLYNNKKAERKLNEANSPRKSPSRMVEMKDEMRSPILPTSKTRSNSTSGGRTKRSSCCCYSMIVLIIGFAALGILAAIASILYMEYFASYNITDLQRTTPKPSFQSKVPLKKVGHSLGEEQKNGMDSTASPGRRSESILFPQSSAKGNEKVVSNDKQSFGIDILVADEKKKEEPASDSVDSSSVIIDDLLNITSQMINSVISDQKVSNPINALLSRNQNLGSHYSKLFELYQGSHPAGSSDEKSVKSERHAPVSETSSELADSDNLVNNDPNSVQHLTEEENFKTQEKVNFDFAKDSSDAVEISAELVKDSSMGENIAKDLFVNSSDAVEISPEIVKHSSMVEEDIAKDSFVENKDIERDLPVAEDPFKDSSEVLEDAKNVFEVSNAASDVSAIDVKPKDMLQVAEDSSHFKPNDVFEENIINDSLNITPENPSNILEITPKEIVELNQEVDKPEPVHDDIAKMEEFHFEPLPQKPEENLSFPNSFRTLNNDFENDVIREEETNVSNPDQPLSNLPIVGATNTSNFIPKFLSQLDRTWGISNLFINRDEELQSNDGKEQEPNSVDETESEDLNRPIQETNIAVPRPVEMIRRFGKEDETNDQSNDLSEHDRRFSLAKALDRLRLLDVNNILSSSRKSKMASPKKKEEPKIQTDLEVATERSHYLENLRKKFFDNE